MRSLVLFKPDPDSEATATAGAESLAPVWRKITAFNPIVTLIGGFKSLFGADANITVNLTLILAILALGLAAAWLAFRAGYRLKS